MYEDGQPDDLPQVVSPGAPYDTNSEEIHIRNANFKPEDDFVLAIGVGVYLNGISRSAFSSLREVLLMLEHEKVQPLPKGVSTLTRKANKIIPRVKLRKKVFL